MAVSWEGFASNQVPQYTVCYLCLEGVDSAVDLAANPAANPAAEPEKWCGHEVNLALPSCHFDHFFHEKCLFLLHKQLRHFSTIPCPLCRKMVTINPRSGLARVIEQSITDIAANSIRQARIVIITGVIAGLIAKVFSGTGRYGLTIAVTFPLLIAAGVVAEPGIAVSPVTRRIASMGAIVVALVVALELEVGVGAARAAALGGAGIGIGVLAGERAPFSALGLLALTVLEVAAVALMEMPRTQDAFPTSNLFFIPAAMVGGGLLTFMSSVGARETLTLLRRVAIASKRLLVGSL